jgi:hypothetical protein
MMQPEDWKAVPLSELDALTKDADRYRWLRENNDKRFVLWDRCTHIMELSPRPVLNLDKVIDEQIAVHNVKLRGE